MVVYVRIACEHKRYSPPCFHVVMDLECRIFFSKSIQSLRKVIDVYFKIFEYSGMVILTIEKLVEPPVKVSPEEHSTPKVAQISPGPITLTSRSMKVTRDAPLLTLNPPLRNTSIYTLAADPHGHAISSGPVVRMWDPRKRIPKLVGHTDIIRSVLISDDARYVSTLLFRGV